MLKLNALSQAHQQKHYALLKKRFDAELATAIAAAPAGHHDAQLISHLKKSLKIILLGTPAQLEAFASAFAIRFKPFSDYAARHRKGSAPEDEIHKNTLAIVHACFDYEWFSAQSNDWGAYALVEAYGLRICPYCQANHVNFHVEKVKGQRGAKAFRMRPALDHYMPKSAYPYLAVSLSNLVPSCAQCNSGVKTSSDPMGRGLAHPLDKTAIKVRFSAKGTIRKNLHGPVQVDEVVISLLGEDPASTSHVEDFRLQERYAWFRHEIKDLMDRDDNHRDLHRDLRRVVPRELYVLGFLETQAGERALGLCLRDIYRELDR